jgi:PAS domain-containing protein
MHRGRGRRVRPAARKLPAFGWRPKLPAVGPLAKLALRESESRFRALFDATATAVTLRDVEAQHLLDCNEAAVRLFGCSNREELLGTHPLDLSPPLQADGTPSPVAARAMLARARRRSPGSNGCSAR